ncbi:tetratricopeptide repeat protein [Thermodesulfobacteriota bacterium]
MIFLLQYSLSVSEIIAYETVSEGTDKAITDGIEYLYDWEFEKAETVFKKVSIDMPDNPMGFFYLAMVSWSRMIAGFWGPEIVDQYGEQIDETISIAKKRINSGTTDSFTYFYLGAALGFKGRFLLMQHRYLSSYLVSLEAINALKTSLEMDQDNIDVLFGLGMYDYYTAKLSGVLKFLSYIFLHKGNKSEGLEKLNITAESARYSKIESNSFLLYIYLFMEEDYQRALPIAKMMAGRFKTNPTHEYLLGITYIRLNMEPEYRSVLEYFHEKSRGEQQKGAFPIWTKRGDYLEASYYLFHAQYDKSRQLLTKIIANPDPEQDPYMIAWPLLKTGMSYDLEGKREKALEYYDQIIDMENGSGAQFLAKKYIASPVETDSPFLGF